MKRCSSCASFPRDRETGCTEPRTRSRPKYEPARRKRRARSRRGIEKPQPAQWQLPLPAARGRAGGAEHWLTIVQRLVRLAAMDETHALLASHLAHRSAVRPGGHRANIDRIARQRGGPRHGRAAARLACRGRRPGPARGPSGRAGARGMGCASHGAHSGAGLRGTGSVSHGSRVRLAPDPTGNPSEAERRRLCERLGRAGAGEQPEAVQPPQRGMLFPQPESGGACRAAALAALFGTVPTCAELQPMHPKHRAPGTHPSGTRRPSPVQGRTERMCGHGEGGGVGGCRARLIASAAAPCHERLATLFAGAQHASLARHSMNFPRGLLACRARRRAAVPLGRSALQITRRVASPRCLPLASQRPQPDCPRSWTLWPPP